MFSSSLTAFHLLLIILHSQFVYIICYVIAVGPPITRSRNYAGFVTLTNTQTVVFVDISMFHTAQPTSTLTTAFSFFSLVMYEIMILVFSIQSRPLLLSDFYAEALIALYRFFPCSFVAKQKSLCSIFHSILVVDVHQSHILCVTFNERRPTSNDPKRHANLYQIKLQTMHHWLCLGDEQQPTSRSNKCNVFNA